MLFPGLPVTKDDIREVIFLIRLDRFGAKRQQKIQQTECRTDCLGVDVRAHGQAHLTGAIQPHREAHLPIQILASAGQFVAATAQPNPVQRLGNSW